MNNQTFLLLCLLLSINAFAQRQDFYGQVKNDSIELYNIAIVNRKAKVGTVTNGFGKFKIPAKVGDSILISGIQINNRMIVVKDMRDEENPQIITVTRAINEIPEVIIKQHDLSGILEKDVASWKNPDSLLVQNGALDFKIDWSKPMKADALKKEKNLTRRLGNTDPTRNFAGSANVLGLVGMAIDLLTNKKKQAERQRINLKKQHQQRELGKLQSAGALEAKLLYHYGEAFFTQDLGIPKEKITEFIDYCNDKKDVANLLFYKRELELINFFLEQSKNYKARLKAE